MSYEQAVEKLYIAYFDHPADAEGLAYWTNVMAQNGGSLEQLSNTFASFSGFGGQSPDAVLSAVSNSVLGHAPDQASHDLYASALASGQLTTAQLVLDILNGAQNGDATVLNNKVEVATDFTAQLAADPTKEANFTAQLTTNGTGDAVAAAQKMLDNVTANSTSADLQQVAADTAQQVNNPPPVAHTDGTAATSPTDGTTAPVAPIDGTTPAPIAPTDGTAPVTPTAPITTDPAILAALAGQQPAVDPQSVVHVDTGAVHTDITVTGISPADATTLAMMG